MGKESKKRREFKESKEEKKNSPVLNNRDRLLEQAKLELEKSEAARLHKSKENIVAEIKSKTAPGMRVVGLDAKGRLAER